MLNYNGPYDDDFASPDSDFQTIFDPDDSSPVIQDDPDALPELVYSMVTGTYPLTKNNIPVDNLEVLQNNGTTALLPFGS